MKLAVFDMAGTTIDDRDEVYRVLREATEKHGASYTDAQFQKYMGTEKRYAIRKLLEINGTNVDEELVERAWSSFREELRRTYLDNPPVPLPGIEDALSALSAQGITIGLTTGFSREIADLILGAMGWEKGRQYDFSCCGDEVEKGRPEPFMIQEVMRQSGIEDPQQVISVGDTESDVLSAQRAQVTSVGVLTGHLSADEFGDLGADIVVESVADLPRRLGLS